MLAAGVKPEVPVGPGVTRIEVAPGADAALLLRRFASGEYPVNAGTAPGGGVVRLRIPRDTAALPWNLQIEASQRVRVCAPEGSG